MTFTDTKRRKRLRSFLGKDEFISCRKTYNTLLAVGHLCTLQMSRACQKYSGSKKRQTAQKVKQNKEQKGELSCPQMTRSTVQRNTKTPPANLLFWSPQVSTWRTKNRLGDTKQRDDSGKSELRLADVTLQIRHRAFTSNR